MDNGNDNSSTPNGSENDRPKGNGRRTLETDIAKAERLIAHATEAGAELARHDIQAVETARKEIALGKLDSRARSAFYAAFRRIASVVKYPTPEIAKDLQLCSELLSHAGQSGKELSNDDIQTVAEARRSAQDFDWNPRKEADFYCAMSNIARAVSPVVAETASFEARKGARIAIRYYSIAAGVLTVCVLFLSCLLFTIKQISEDISKTVQSNDPLAVSLHNQLQEYSGTIEKANQVATDEALVLAQNSPAATEIKESLQKFATNNRQLYADVTRTRAISSFLFRLPNMTGHFIMGKNWGLDWGAVASRYLPDCPHDMADGVPNPTHLASFSTTSVPENQGSSKKKTENWQCGIDSIRRALEIDLPLFDRGLLPHGSKPYIPADAVKQGFQKIAIYQDIRAMATYAQDIILDFVGMVTGFILPVLYAWLGACAAILRQLRADSAASVFHPEHSKVANRSHVTTAIIVGISIGLFSGLIQGETTVSPLAVAFVAGYASDKFFEFVDRLVGAMFPSSKSPAPARPGMASPGAREETQTAQKEKIV